MQTQINELKTKLKNKILLDEIILVLLVLNLGFAVFNYYRLQMTEQLLDNRAVVQVDFIKVNLEKGTLSPEQIAVYRKNWVTSGYSRVAPVEILDKYQGQQK